MVDGSWMGPVGLGLAVLGGSGRFVAHRRLERVYTGLPPELVEAANRSLGRLQYAVAGIVGALAIYFEARTLGHGREGLYACVALLWLNAAVVAFLRVGQNQLNPSRRIIL